MVRSVEFNSVFQGFNEMLRVNFDGTPASGWVQTQSFQIFNEDSGSSPMSMSNWEDHLVPGMLLSMAMLLKEKREMAQSNDRQSCPSCGWTCKTSPNSCDRVRWYAHFYVFDILLELMIFYAQYTLPKMVSVAAPRGSGPVRTSVAANSREYCHRVCWHKALAYSA